MTKNQKLAVILGVITMVGGWGTALLSNWDKVFPRKIAPSQVDQTPATVEKLIALTDERARLDERLKNFSAVEAKRIYEEIRKADEKLKEIRGKLRLTFANAYLERAKQFEAEARVASGDNKSKLERKAVAFDVAYRLIVMDHASAPDFTVMAQLYLDAEGGNKKLNLSDSRLNFKPIPVEPNDPKGKSE